MFPGKLTKILDSAILNRLEQKRDYIGASNVGSTCERAIWYRYNSDVIPKKTAKQRRTLEIGKRLERMVINFLQEAELEVEIPSKDNAFLAFTDAGNHKFKGHADALLLNFPYGVKSILEIKTARDSSFRVFQKNGLKKWYPIYYAQVQSYMGMSGIHSAFVLAINKDTSELHDEQIHFDKSFYLSLREKSQRIIEMVEAPSRIANSPLHFVCRMCDFRNICFT